MEPLWLKWCRENMPSDMFSEMENSRRHDAAWRDTEIARLHKLIENVKKALMDDKKSCIGCGGNGCLACNERQTENDSNPEI